MRSVGDLGFHNQDRRANDPMFYVEIFHFRRRLMRGDGQKGFKKDRNDVEFHRNDPYPWQCTILNENNENLSTMMAK